MASTAARSASYFAPDPAPQSAPVAIAADPSERLAQAGAAYYRMLRHRSNYERLSAYANPSRQMKADRMKAFTGENEARKELEACLKVDS